MDNLKDIIQHPSEFSNKDLENSLSYLSDNFDKTKTEILSLTQILDFTENSYNKILKEYNKRK